MFQQVRFYLSHSFNDLRVSKRLTFFALLSIAAGVAAIVSLQTLAVMIGDALEQNLQETNRGDLSVAFEPGESIDGIELAVEEGLVNENTMSFFGQSESFYALSEEGLAAIQTWIDESEFSGEAEFTYRLWVTDMIGVLTGSGDGTLLTDVETGNQVSQLTPVITDTDVYPYYDTLLTTDGQPVADLLQDPTDIVIAQNIADDLELSNGDTVQIKGSSATYTVRGIVALETEVKNAETDFFLGLFGFYYLDWRSVELFDEITPQSESLYFRLDNPERLNEFDNALRAEFPFLETTTTDDLRSNNEELVEQIDQLVTIMGLVSLLVGSIGIVNTMQVIVRRRMLEIAVLKTLGLQAEQVTILFLAEAFLLGIVGSIAGVFLGWASTFVIKGVAEVVFGTAMSFRIAAEPVINGLIIGILVSTVFGFLPTLAAGQVRPGTVLRPRQSSIPQAGKLRSFFALLLVIVVVSFIVWGILDNLLLAFAVVSGAFLVAGLMYVLLWILIWAIGRFFPSFGNVDLKISLRQMHASRGRGASTLLALVVGVFSLSLITLFSESISNILEAAFEDAGGNVIVSVQSYDRLPDVEAALNSLDGVNQYTVALGYQAKLIRYEDAESGESYDADGLLQKMQDADINFPPFFQGPEEEKDEIQERILESGLLEVAIEARDVNADGEEQDIVYTSGRGLLPEDDGQPYLVFQGMDLLEELGLSAGDRVTYQIQNSGLLSRGGEEITFEIIGVEAERVSINAGSNVHAPAGVFPESINPTTVSLLVDIAEEDVPELRRTLADIPGTFALDTAVFSRLITSLIGTFTAFPSMVAALGLVVGGVVIANSVALATMERRHEIAVMKAVGLQRERVLGMLLLENAILGFIGGLFGVGYGVLAMVAFARTSQVPLSTIPFGIAFLLMLLCVGVALIAALTSAWEASGEKPLTVLRMD